MKRKILLIILLPCTLAMYSCRSSLQTTKGYENYDPNTDWRTRKL